MNNPYLKYRSETLQEGNNPDQNMKVVNCFETEGVQNLKNRDMGC